MSNLLIVDDNPGLREGISSFFEEQGHHSMTASGVKEAVEIIRHKTPDLVLSDLMMDDGTGLGLRQQIRQLCLRQDPYFILLTGHPNFDNARDAYNNGVDLYLTKPFQLPALALAVDNALRKRQMMTADPAVKPAENFYHDLSLALNPVFPRLLMLMGGRYGALDPAQSTSMTALFETWRRLVWTMADFQQRMQDPESGQIECALWSGPPALERVLEKLLPDLGSAGVQVNVAREERLPLGNVHAPTAEAVLEALILRLTCFSAPGATLHLAWTAPDKRLELVFHSDRAHPDLSAALRSQVALLPPIYSVLEEAGIRINLSDDLGPWSVSFDWVH